MATRAKAGKRAAANGKSTKKRKRASPAEIAEGVETLAKNGVTKDDVMEYFDQVDRITDRMEEENAAARGDINAVYDRACEGLGVVKESLTLMYQEHRRRQKALKKAGKMGTTSRESLQKLAQALKGLPLGDWATMLSKAEPQQAAGE